MGGKKKHSELAQRVNQMQLCRRCVPGFVWLSPYLNSTLKTACCWKHRVELLSPRQQPINGCLKYQKNQLTLTKTRARTHPEHSRFHILRVYMTYEMLPWTPSGGAVTKHIMKITLKHGRRGLSLFRMSQCALWSVWQNELAIFERHVVKCLNTPGTR